MCCQRFDKEKNTYHIKQKRSGLTSTTNVLCNSRCIVESILFHQSYNKGLLGVH